MTPLKRSLNSENIYILGTGNFGRLVLQGLRRLGLKPHAFIDLNPLNVGKSIDGIYVKSLVEVLKGHVIVASNRNSIKYLYGLLDKNVGLTYDLCDFVFDDFVYEEIDLDWSPARVTSEIKNFLMRVKDGDRDGLGVSLNSLDIVLTEKCSLKCKDCSNLMQYYTAPKNSDHVSLLEELGVVLAAVDRISEVRLIGGEPLLYKNLDEVLFFLSSFDNFGEIVIYTNGTIVPKESLLSVSTDPRFRYQISDYGSLSKNTSKLVETLSEKNIRYVHDRVLSWQDCATIDRKNRSPEQTEFVYSNCCVNDAFTLLHGKIFGCPFSAHAENLNAIPMFKKDSVDIRTLNTSQIVARLKELKNIRFLGACSYCNGRDYTVAKVPAAIQTSQPLHYMPIKEPLQNPRSHKVSER